MKSIYEVQIGRQMCPNGWRPRLPKGQLCLFCYSDLAEEQAMDETFFKKLFGYMKEQPESNSLKAGIKWHTKGILSWTESCTQLYCSLYIGVEMVLTKNLVNFNLSAWYSNSWVYMYLHVRNFSGYYIGGCRGGPPNHHI